MKPIRIFYRNRPGKDSKILGWSEVLHDPPVFQGKLMTDPANEFVSFVDTHDHGDTYQSANSSGVFLSKVVDGAIVPRDPSDIAKDRGNKVVIIEAANQQIDVYLQGREKATWLMYGAEKMYQYVTAMQQALGVSDNELSVEGLAAKTALINMRAGMAGPIDQIMAARDAQLALLDQED